MLNILLHLKEFSYLEQVLQRFLYCASWYFQGREIRIVKVITIMSYLEELKERRYLTVVFSFLKNCDLDEKVFAAWHQ